MGEKAGVIGLGFSRFLGKAEGWGVFIGEFTEDEIPPP